MSRFRTDSGERLQWRVLVQTAGRLDPSKASLPLAWHLVHCAEPMLASSHCAVGQQLLAGDADPDGHCLLNGVCPRCADQDTASPAR